MQGRLRKRRALSRRCFIHGGLAAAGSLALSAPFSRLLARAAEGQSATGCGYGPLAAAIDETTGLPLIKLPPGFRYLSMGWTGDPLSDGAPTPRSHDGMACVAQRGDLLTLIRNHEIAEAQGSFAAPSLTFDAKAGGGTTTLVFDGVRGQLVDAFASLSGTILNCAGGPTPWGSWLTCEEVVYSPGDVLGKEGWQPPLEREHGFVFEVPATGASAAKPLMDMGKFVHEAVAVDPLSGMAYLTEDNTPAGFYRFVPNKKGNFAAGGQLQMACVPGVEQLVTGVDPARNYPVQWLDIAEPARGSTPGAADRHGVFHQGKETGGTSFTRLEGCAWGAGEVFFTSTNGGEIGCGQVYAYSPSAESLRLVYETADREVLDYPDNLTLSPRGGLVICEDGARAAPMMHGLSTQGELFSFAQNNVLLDGERNGIAGDFRRSEWAGVSYSPDGKWLFVNVQRPGITLAITGPWQRGLL